MTRMIKILAVLIILHVSSLCASCSQVVGNKPQAVEDVFLPAGDRVQTEVWIENLKIPWSLIFLPDGRALVSERPGTIRTIKSGKLLQRPYARINVKHVGEGGLMGLAVHPSFPKEPYVYAMHTYEKGDKLYNRVIRLKDTGSEGIFDKIIIDNIPAGRLHNGGRIAFGPDGMLYITPVKPFMRNSHRTSIPLAEKF